MKKFFSILLIISYPIFGTNIDSWKKINSVDEVRQFVGRVIACKAINSSFCGKGYKLSSDDIVNYIELREVPQEKILSYGSLFEGVQLIGSKDKVNYCGLTAQMIKNNSLYMRELYQQERDLIRQAINDDKAKFSYKCNNSRVNL